MPCDGLRGHQTGAVLPAAAVAPAAGGGGGTVLRGESGRLGDGPGGGCCCKARPCQRIVSLAGARLQDLRTARPSGVLCFPPQLLVDATCTVTHSGAGPRLCGGPGWWRRVGWRAPPPTTTTTLTVASGGLHDAFVSAWWQRGPQQDAAGGAASDPHPRPTLAEQQDSGPGREEACGRQAQTASASGVEASHAVHTAGHGAGQGQGQGLTRLPSCAEPIYGQPPGLYAPRKTPSSTLRTSGSRGQAQGSWAREAAGAGVGGAGSVGGRPQSGDQHFTHPYIRPVQDLEMADARCVHSWCWRHPCDRRGASGGTVPRCRGHPG